MGIPFQDQRKTLGVRNRIIEIVSLLVVPLLFLSQASAQSGTIAGKLIDETNAEPLIGAAVYLETDPSIGSATDLDGRYRISAVPEGTHNVVIRYVSYQTKTITDVVVKSGELTNLDATMANSSELLGEVVIRESYTRESVAAIYTMQKKAIAVQDGISRDLIARSPDNNTGEVLKRLPGTTIQDNKFAIVRGLSDRYNNAMVNGLLLPSTEPDRKAFAFDLYPSALLDYLIITKTAQPDLPGEFAGGIIQLATRDIPDENFLEINLGTGMDTRTTFQPYISYPGGGTDWLGTDDGSRSLPADFPNDPNEVRASTTEQLAGYARGFNNNWQLDRSGNGLPNRNLQLAGGLATDVGHDNRLGVIAGVTYGANNTYRRARELNYFGVSGDTAFAYDDDYYQENVQVGTMLNMGFKLKNRHKFNWRNDYSINGTDRVIFREGRDYVGNLQEQRSLYEFISRKVLNSALSGDHAIGDSKARIDWTAGYNIINRDQPDMRTGRYVLDQADSTYKLIAAPVPNFSSNGHFFSELQEKTYSAALNISLPFQIGNQSQNVKVGGYLQEKTRDFNARILGYRVPVLFYSDPEYQNIVASPLEEIFVPENLTPNRFYIDEITNASDRYSGNSSMQAAYVMLDNKVGNKLRLVWGVRMEQFTQNIETADKSAGNEAEQRIQNDTTYLDFLPSLNLTYALSDRINIRTSGSKTLARPEFRERALFNYYNFQNFTNVRGNLDLLPTDIYNADVRFEYYPGGGQIISVTGFYKFFDNPISYLRLPGEGGGGLGTDEAPINEDQARNIGIETEVRKNFDFIGVEQLIFSTNLAYINSVAKLDTGLVANQVGDAERGLFYQSPWIVNLGLSWLDKEGRFEATVLFNSYGSRRVRLGNANYPDIFEAPQNRLDAQIGVTISKGLRMKITGENLLRAPIIQYWDLGNGTPSDPQNNGRYDKDLDPVLSRIEPGAGISVSLSWRIN